MKLKTIAVLVLAVYAAGVTTHEIVTYANANETVIKVNDKELSRTEVEERILTNFWNDSISMITDEALISEEAEKLKVDHPSTQEIEEEGQLLQSLEERSINLTDPNVLTFLKERVIVKKLAQKYTVTEEVIQALESQGGTVTAASVDGVLFEGAHEVMEKIQHELEAGANVEDVATKYQSAAQDVHLEEGNEYKLDLKSLQVGDVQHIHSSTKHAILVVKKVNAATGEAPTDHEELVKRYLNQEYNLEKSNVINYLRSQYDIESKTLTGNAL